MNQAQLIHTSTFLTKYFASEPVIFVGEEGNGDTVTGLYWTYMLNDVTGHSALAVMLDLETDALVIEEAQGYSFTDEARCMLKGFALEHGLECLISAVHVDGSGPIEETAEVQQSPQVIH